MIFESINEHRSEFPVERMCEVLGVSRSGYYSWVQRENNSKQGEKEQIIQTMLDVEEDYKWKCGSPRMTDELRKRGIKRCENTVAKIMRENGIKVKPKRQYVSTTDSKHGYLIADNILNRNFKATAPNQKWVSDITYIEVNEQWKYLCVIIDLYSRRVVGWSFDERMRVDLVVDAFLMAVLNRNPPPGLIFHSDRGKQYASYEFREYLERYGMVQSMSRSGNCLDNSCAESFFKSLKYEWLEDVELTNMVHARMVLFDYIECFYNGTRIHTYLNGKTPREFEEEMIL